MCAGCRGLQHIEGAHCQLVSMEGPRASGALIARRPRLHHINVSIEDVPWLVLPKMMAVASDIFEEVQRRKASRDRSPVRAPPAKKAKGGLRQRDPWEHGGVLHRVEPWTLHRVKPSVGRACTVIFKECALLVGGTHEARCMGHLMASIGGLGSATKIRKCTLLL